MELSFESSSYVTPEAFARWVESRQGWDPNRYELLNGRVIMNPPAGWPHGGMESNIQWLLNQFVRQRKLGVVPGSSQGFRLPSGDTVAPDAAFISHERWSSAPPVEGEFLHVVPDLAVEVLSPSTASRDRGEKKSIYERNGVTEYWLVDPRARTLTACFIVDGRYAEPARFESGQRFASRVLPGLEFEVGELFATP